VVLYAAVGFETLRRWLRPRRAPLRLVEREP
jgi:hypothetical protein